MAFLYLSDYSGLASGTDWTAAISAWINDSQNDGYILIMDVVADVRTNTTVFSSFTKEVRIIGLGAIQSVIGTNESSGGPTFGETLTLGFVECARVTIEHVSFNGRGIETSAANTCLLGFTLTPFTVDNCRFYGAYRIGLMAIGANDYVIANSFFARNGLAIENDYQNEAILIGNNGDTPGYESRRGRIYNVTALGWGTIFDGDDLIIDGFYCDGFGYGAGITLNANSCRNPTARNFVVRNGQGLDVNNTYAGGVECWADGAFVENGRVYNCSGTGIVVAGRRSKVIDCYVQNSGISSLGYPSAGFATLGQSNAANASGSIFQNCLSEDTGRGVQAYGYAEPDQWIDHDPAALVDVQFINCSFSGVTGSMRLGASASRHGWRGITIVGSSTYNPPSLANGSAAETSLTIGNATLGDLVTASFSLDTQGIVVQGRVSSTNTVTVRFQNQTGGTIDLGSGTVRAVVEKGMPA